MILEMGEKRKTRRMNLMDRQELEKQSYRQGEMDCPLQ